MTEDRTGRLAGQRVIVAGGGGSVGSALSAALAAQGARVVVADVALEYARDVAKQIAADGFEARPVHLDVTRADSIKAALAESVEWLGGLDSLINSTGVSASAPMLEVTEEHWDRIHDVNLKGAFMLAQAGARVMAEQGTGGSIVTITSTNAERGVLNHVPYGASKGGLRQMVMGMAADLAPYDIRVNNVGPGMMATTMRNNASTEVRTKVPRKVLRGRLPTGEDVAKVVSFLISDEGEYITGANLYVDGGALTGLF
ncbi:glucose 1-dehydrogenase [Thermocatellispora tengchongensis]|uniref:Glucose 1-dehydrogenase n=1 Tax=Thermocatellispora tengchongensis TaxID=1073253 RepID=A0A840PG84_9ACTN|nr:SDR family oxidoreductase [Thermocatellispora tengchongensis]MBB5136851.1 glucose 1-dehydrogenase [Thermocatellispora tengchongensis]